MITLTASSTQGNAPLAVSYKMLLSLYAIIPLCVILQLTDSYAFGGAVMQSLPTSPGHFILFQLLFGTPHILASGILITSNKDYFAFYHKKILYMTLALMVFFAIATQLVSYYVLYIMVASWTVYHALKQQHGVGRGIYQLPAWAFYLLLWLSIAAGISVYMGIFLKNTLTVQQAEWVRQAAGYLLIIKHLLVSAICQDSVRFYVYVGEFFVDRQQFLFLYLAILLPGHLNSAPGA